jgi:hypothetical protein
VAVVTDDDSDWARKMHESGIHTYDIYTPAHMQGDRIYAHPVHMAALVHPETSGSDWHDSFAWRVDVGREKRLFAMARWLGGSDD